MPLVNTLRIIFSTQIESMSNINLSVRGNLQQTIMVVQV